MRTALLLFILALTHADIFVYSPDSLRQTITNKYGSSKPIPSSLANFGNPPYGSIMVGRVFYAEQENQNDACGNLKQIDFTGDPDIVNTPILLVDRGGCTFSQKVRHAQNIGARAVVIVDNKDENVSNVIMADDGSAGNIYIPSFLISKSDGDIIKTSLHGGFGWEVALELTFVMAKLSSTVEYQLFMTSSNELIREFLYNFTEIATQFEEKEITFTPHYVFWFCIECRNQQYQIEDPDCFSGGRYCAPDPDNSGPRSGRDIVMEDLRQMCIYQQSKNKKQWWKYVQHQYKECSLEHFGESCSQKAAKKANVDWDKVKKCVDSSWEGQNPSMDDNKLLREEKEI